MNGYTIAQVILNTISAILVIINITSAIYFYRHREWKK